VSNILLRNVAFYQLKQCRFPQGLNQKLQNLLFSYSSPLTTKHCDRYLHTHLLMFYMFGSLLPCKFDGCKLSLSLFDIRDLQNINWYIDRIQAHLLLSVVCKFRSSHIGSNNLLHCCKGKSNYLNLLSVECVI